MRIKQPLIVLGTREDPPVLLGTDPSTVDGFQA